MINLKSIDEVNPTNVIVKPILRAVRYKQENFTILGTGKSGGGKSAALIRILSECDPTFNADRIVFNAADFIKLIRDKSLKAGSAILFDEVGESVGARTFMAKQQRDLLIYMQNYRIKRLIVGFTIPHTSFADVQLRRMAHAYLEYISKRLGHKRTYWKYKLNQFIDNQYGQPMFQYPIVRFPNGSHHRVIKLGVRFPPKALWKTYLPKKYENIAHLESKMLQSKEVKEAIKPTDDELIKSLCEFVSKDKERYTHTWNGQQKIVSPLAVDYLQTTFNIRKGKSILIIAKTERILFKK